MVAVIEPIVGRYVHIEILGAPYRIYFEEAGQGIPLLCLHTAGAHSSQFRHLMSDEAVTSRYRVIAFDLPWHGKSNPPVGWEKQEYLLTADFYVGAILAFAEALNLDKPVVMGCSMGGRVAVRLACLHGDLFRAAIGLEGSNRPSPWWDSSWLTSDLFARGDFCAAVVSGLASPHSPDEFRNETLWHYQQSGSDIFKGDMHFFRTDSEFEADSESAAPCPLILMTGEYDYSCTPADAERTAAQIPGAEAITMRGMGHFPMSEHPGRFRKYILPVLDRIATL
jgi:pimeloyl-ACP methyl ester carboxylesterase